jgi:hypothetical protein
MTEFIAGGRAIDWIFVLVALEAAALAALRAFTGRGPAPLAFIANLLSGAFLLLALRSALAGGSFAVIGLCLIGALIAHVADVVVRWETPASRQASIPGPAPVRTTLSLRVTKARVRPALRAQKEESSDE